MSDSLHGLGVQGNTSFIEEEWLESGQSRGEVSGGHIIDRLANNSHAQATWCWLWGSWYLSNFSNFSFDGIGHEELGLSGNTK